MSKRPIGRADTDEKKRAMLDLILEQWKRAPNQRLGQLMINACDDKLYAIEDDELVHAVEQVVDRMPKYKP